MISNRVCIMNLCKVSARAADFTRVSAQNSKICLRSKRTFFEVNRTLKTSAAQCRQCFSRMYESLIIDQKRPTDSDMSCHSQKLMLYGGLMDHAHTGAYHLLPMGLRSLNKLKRAINESMTEIGAQEVDLASLSSAALWKKSGRWELTGSELFKLKDRHETEYCLGPTYEEVITSLVASRSPMSYKKLPILLYQISRKFRDEMAPKYGLLRGREFEMKDLYTFDESEEKARETYESVCTAYERLFNRLKLNFVKVVGDTGTIGGSLSHEYHLPADIGEDQLVFCDGCGFASNEELLNDPTDQCSKCGGKLTRSKGIEIGHSFLLGTKYSSVFNATFRNVDGKYPLLEMGCYGLGVTRILAAGVETLSTDTCIRWPALIAPYQLCIIPQKDGYKSEVTTSLAESLYDHVTSLPNMWDEVVLDDRTKLSIGRRLQHADNLGYPFIVVLGKQALGTPPKFEFMDVTNGSTQYLEQHELLQFLSKVETLRS